MKVIPIIPIVCFMQWLLDECFGLPTNQSLLLLTNIIILCRIWCAYLVRWFAAILGQRYSL